MTDYRPIFSFNDRLPPRLSPIFYWFFIDITDNWPIINLRANHHRLLTDHQRLLNDLSTNLILNYQLELCKLLHIQNWTDRPNWPDSPNWPDRPNWPESRNWPDRPNWPDRLNWPIRPNKPDWPDSPIRPRGQIDHIN